MATILKLHVGLPKTGTSALQFWLDENRIRLRDQGITYPTTDGSTAEPKHQFLIQNLLSNEFTSLGQTLAENDQPTLLLSAEGLTNHLYDFDSASLDEFRKITSSFEKSIVLVVRDITKWSKSYWKQAVVNPPIREYDYATPLRLEQFRKIPRVKRLCNHDTLVNDLQNAYGANDVRVVNYEGNYLDEFCDALGIQRSKEMGNPEPGNVSISDDVIEIIRQLNESDHSSEVRNVILAAVQQCVESNHIGLTTFYNLQSARTQDLSAARSAVAMLTPQTESQRKIIDRLKNLLVA